MLPPTSVAGASSSSQPPSTTRIIPVYRRRRGPTGDDRHGVFGQPVQTISHGVEPSAGALRRLLGGTRRPASAGQKPTAAVDSDTWTPDVGARKSTVLSWALKAERRRRTVPHRSGLCVWHLTAVYCHLSWTRAAVLLQAVYGPADTVAS